MVAGPLGFLLGLSLGAGLPDADRALGLVHRSIITHGLLFPLLFWLIAQSRNTSASRLFTIGFCVATGVHLAFDLFPRAWLGASIIYIPAIGSGGLVFSWCWIAVSIVVSIYIALALAKSNTDLVYAFLGFALVFLLSYPLERAFWLPLIALAVSFAFAYRLPSSGAEIIRQRFQRQTM
jgi:hypothetical protein